MNTALFVDWVKLFDRKMKLAGRHVLLLDNAPSHPHDIKLDNVKMVFLPANTTSRLQPLDQGIINNLKQIYKKRLLRSVISKIDENESVSADTVCKSVTVLDTVNWISTSVKEIKPETVTKCFRKCGLFIREGGTVSECNDDDDNDDNIPILELVEMMRAAHGKISFKDKMSSEEYCGMDDSVPTCEGLSDNWEADLTDSVRCDTNQSEESVEDEDEETDEPLLIKSHHEALKWIHQLRMYCLNKDLPKVISSFDNAQEELEKLCVKVKCASQQTTLDNFFSVK